MEATHDRPGDEAAGGPLPAPGDEAAGCPLPLPAGAICPHPTGKLGPCPRPSRATCPRLRAEAGMRRILDDNDLAPPDRVEQWEVSVAFFWDEQKLVVAIELCDPPPGL